jgi:predicted TIM-barrel fold metal-dependent hydrolase
MGERRKKSEPEDQPRSPIAFAPCSNGEFSPGHPTPRDLRARERFLQIVEEKHRRLGLTRRDFAQSVCGVASALLVMNEVYGCSSDKARGPSRPSHAGSSGSDAGYAVTPEMTEDSGLACESLKRDTFVFDVQLHPPNPLTPWTDRALPMDADTFMRAAFVDSETSVGVLSGVPDTRSLDRPNLTANRMLQELIERYAGPRLFCHANLDPSRGPSELDYMQDVHARYPLAAWKVYPHVGAWRLDSEEVGLPFLQRSRELGLFRVAAHRGIADDAGDYAAPSSPVDLVRAAQVFPDIQFLTYHSGWQSNVDENHAFDPNQTNPSGVDRLIKAVLDHEIGKAGNVYAELGSTWRNLMTQPQAAAHVLGKLLRYLGEDRVLWGTDAVFTGSPQEQIVALRAFQIPESMRETYGYPALTDRVRAKIFGANAARVYGIDPDAVRCELDADAISRERSARLIDPREVPVPRERSYGPRSRREFLAFARFERSLRDGET